MSLDLGELRIALNLDQDGFTRGLAEARAELETLPDTAQTEIRRVTRTMNTEGQAAGRSLGQGMQQGFAATNPGITAAISGALVAGAPALLGAAGSLFIAIAAAAEHSNADLQQQFNDTGDVIERTFTDAAQVTVPFFVDAMQRIGSAVQQLEPQFVSAFSALGGPVDSLTTGVIALAKNAMPGLVKAVQTSDPVFDGLKNLLSDVGSGLGQMFSIISQHSGAAGTVFTALGSALGALLPALGQLIGEGAELGSAILPPIAAGLHLVGDALAVVGPALPAVVGGLVGMKVAALLVGPMAALAQNLAFASYQGGVFGRTAGVASRAVSGLGSALPLIAVGAGVVAAVLPGLINLLHEGSASSDEAKAQTLTLTQALQASSGAINDNIRAMQLQKAQQDGVLDYAHKAGVSLPLVTRALTGNKDALNEVNTALQAYIDKHPGGIHDKEAFGAKNAKNSLNDLAAALGVAQSNTSQLNAAEQGASATAQTNAQRLQALADKAGVANTQIGLLKSALDALTGKAVTMDQAEIAVTQAVDAATQAIKGKTAALSFSNGQLDLSNSKSATAAQLLIGLAGSQKQVIATAEQQGQTMGQVNKIADDQRAQFIKVAESLGATSAQAQALANRYLGIPKSVHTEVTADTAQATAAAAAFKAYWDSIQSRHVVMTASYVSYGGLGRLGSTTAEALGGIVQPMASGGILPMAQGGTANIFQPHNPLIMVGDNQRVPEAYIPIDNSARSRAIFAETAARMGYSLEGMAHGPGGAGRAVYDQRNVTIQTMDVRGAIRQLDEQQRVREFLSGVA